MRRVAGVLALLAGACGKGSGSDDTGTLWFVSAGDSHLVQVDISSKRSTPVQGTAGVTHLRFDMTSSLLAYSEGARIFVVDVAGAITEMHPDAGEVSGAPTWNNGGWLSYPVSSNSLPYFAISRPPAQPRLVATVDPVVFSWDGRDIAYFSSGDLVVEHADDGTDHRTIAAGTALQDLAFQPDDQGILASTEGATLVAFSLSGSNTRDLGAGEIFSTSDPSAFASSAFSYDGIHVLASDPMGIFSFSLADGSRRYVATTPTDLFKRSAVFTPSGGILYATQVNLSGGDAVMLAGTVSIDDGTSIQVLASGYGNGPCAPVELSRSGRYVAISCSDNIGIFDLLDASTTTRIAAQVFVGFEQDELAFLAETEDGGVSVVSIDGSRTEQILEPGSAQIGEVAFAP